MPAIHMGGSGRVIRCIGNGRVATAIRSVLMPLVPLTEREIDKPVSKLTEFLGKLVYVPTHQVEGIRPFGQNGHGDSTLNHGHADPHLSQLLRVQMQVDRSVRGPCHHIRNLVSDMTWQIDTRHGDVRAQRRSCSAYC